MRFGALEMLGRSGRTGINIASWHSPHSLTWSWILSVSWAVPGYVKPHWQWQKVGPHGFYGLSVGSLINVHAMLHNGGWQGGVTLLGLSLSWHRQQPMWFRDLYHRQRDEKDGLRRRAA